jgi:hypothetical protein
MYSEEKDWERLDYNIHAEHIYSYSCVLEVVTYKIETHLNMLHSKEG